MKPRHMMADCPLLKSEPDKLKHKKAMCAPWNVLQNSTKEESKNEEAMICFVAIKENEDESSDTKVNDQNPSYDDLLCSSETMHETCKSY